MSPPSPVQPPTRRLLLKTALVGSFAAALPCSLRLVAAEPAPRHIVLCSGWQFVNIGDLSQTFGLLRLFEQYFPDARLTLWLAHGNDAVVTSLAARFPKARILLSTIDPKTLVVSNDTLKAALESADLVVHGSGQLAQPELLDWCQANKKKFGLFGVSLGNMDEKTRTRLSNASFVFVRETLSLEALTKAKIKGPIVGFVPDDAMAINVRDDVHAIDFLKESGLEQGKFVCAIPRLRYTPFRHYPAEQIRQRAEASEKFAEPDHAKLRAAMASAIQKGFKVLVCPEMTYELDIMDRLLIDPLPAEVKKSVAKRPTFWQPDEAMGVYARSAAVIGFEFHSPLLAIATGVPGVYLRQPTDTRRGQMFRDIGLSEWIHEVDDAPAEKVSQTLATILSDPSTAKQKAAKAMELVQNRYKEAMEKI